ncbi:uncharacterized protein CANTADRAFT_90627 [Suhomyces tanzawaensis NRRL Y-17324]|uniref:Vacuolar ATPase assembly integral membrane protein n=1 Tax=Suhomyces tanzawaensis NRRL Y-17324 TaxID=984487 RepID=A0A1E4SFH6_9ASCO|nr:uncharacterized protein CANTADRAFT_90627 [Suhomyces tanzawaensis NRRL Y-17324]ODV78261.1 hypothetical protein CANTADRAFT_90627 [Suhomyces tanzawaensis NRRL Y-17324]
MTLFEITPELKKIIEESPLEPKLAGELVAQKYISHTNLAQFYNLYHPTPTFLGLVQKARLRTRNYDEPKKAQTPEFIKSMERLRLEAKEREYERLVNPSPQHQTLYEQSNDQLTPAQAHKELKSQVTTIVNILISVASVAYAIWYWTDTSWKLKDSYRILLCLFFALLVLVAEVVVYLGYLNKIEDAKVTERRTKEVKKVLRSVDLIALKVV